MRLAPVVLILSAVLPGAGPGAGDENWPSFRGPRASGVVEGSPAPVRWDVPKGQNVKWKVPVPGLAHSCPVVWEDRVYVVTSVREGEAELRIGLYGSIQPVDEPMPHRWMVLCLDKATGKTLWSRTAHEGVPRVKRHPKSSHANSTPATDGRHVVCLLGSEGLFCFDVEGKLLWRKDLGPLDSGYYVVPAAQWGFASSPVLHDGRVLLQCDVQKGSFLAALDVKDGREIWRVAREEVPTWGSPTVDVRPGRAQVVVNGYKHIGGYDLETGKELWRMRGGGDIPVPTPIVAHDLVFVTNAHGRMAPIYAILPGAAGDVSLPADQTAGKGVRWSSTRGGNYMQTPIVYGDHLYCCTDAGMLACYDARTGANLYRERLGTGGAGFTASAVGTDGKLYFTSEPGVVHVVRAGPRFEVLSRNEMGDPCMATPAISGGTLFFRTRGHLVAVAEKAP